MDQPEKLTISASTISEISPDIELFPHQVDCVKWLLERETSGIKGSILGDVMGLGKTRSAVTLLSLNPLNRTLVACPKSLLCQWARELILQKHKVYFINSNSACKVTLMDDKITFHKKERRHRDLPQPFVGITSYGKIKPFPEPDHKKETETNVFVCTREGFEGATDKSLKPFRRITWDRIIVDEVHNLRNGVSLKGDKSAALRKKSLRYYRMSRLRKTKDTIILGLTGTPLQNRVGDLASVFLFLGCELTNKTSEEQLKVYINLHLFRRNVSNLTELTKALISFPSEPYCDNRVVVEYESKEEHDFYLAATGNLSEKFKALLGGYEGLVSEDNVLLLLTLLRLLSSHPMSFVKCYNKRYDDKIPEWTGSVSKYNMIEAQLFSYSSSNQSCIVFVHFHEEANRISELNHGYDIVEFIHGGINISDREFVCVYSKKVIEKGYEVGGLRVPGKYLIIANINTCGEGLNLQHFSNVIFSSPDYNPALEEQAIGRVYRIGSTRRVNVTRYYHKEIKDLCHYHNIDKFMEKKQKHKKELAERLIDNTPNAAWKYSITKIPSYDEPCTVFPVIPIVRTSITKAPASKKKPLIETKKTLEGIELN